MGGWVWAGVGNGGENAQENKKRAQRSAPAKKYTWFIQTAQRSVDSIPSMSRIERREERQQVGQHLGQQQHVETQPLDLPTGLCAPEARCFKMGLPAAGSGRDGSVPVSSVRAQSRRTASIFSL